MEGKERDTCREEGLCGQSVPSSPDQASFLPTQLKPCVALDTCSYSHRQSLLVTVWGPQLPGAGFKSCFNPLPAERSQARPLLGLSFLTGKGEASASAGELTVRARAGV